VTLDVSPGTASASESNGRFKIEGNAGTFRVGLQGDVIANGEDLTIAGLARLRSARVDLSGDIEARDGAALIGFLGLERFVVADKGTGRITATARGAFDGDMTVDSRLVADGLDASAKGKIRLTGNRGPTADMEVKVARLNMRVPRSAGHAAESIPAAVSTRLALAEGNISLSDLAGTIAGTDINGRLTVGFADSINVGGELSLGALHLPAAIAAVIGVPRVVGGSWPSEPFEQGLIGSVAGSVKVRVGRVALSPQLTVANMRGVLQFGHDSFALEGIDGSIAGGRVAGSLSFERGEDGLNLDIHARLASTNLVDLLPSGGALTGRATVDFDLQASAAARSRWSGRSRAMGPSRFRTAPSCASIHWRSRR
jgi:uncharacterized protein involved in outer membrane biogenesis